jgi:hypothetical protein
LDKSVRFEAASVASRPKEDLVSFVDKMKDGIDAITSWKMDIRDLDPSKTRDEILEEKRFKLNNA